MRYLSPFVANDLEKKMVFLAGPRQCGNTTLAEGLLKAHKKGGRFFNWDRERDRKAILAEQWTDQDNLLIFDEIHKFRKWKTWVKGVYDTENKVHQILVTGSARLDVYRRGGDSLLGRYHLWRLHPFSLHEFPKSMSAEDAYSRLMVSGGFPEPFLGGDKRTGNRWRTSRIEAVLREDIRDLEAIQDLQSLSLLVELLRSRVGGPIVMSNLAADLQVAPLTVARWILALERMYVLFQVRPFTVNVARAIQKPPKIFFYDNGEVEGDEGARFENLVATHLLKKIHFLSDYTGDRYELFYIRDKEKREVDFAITRNRKLETLIETKLSDKTPSSALYHFAERLKPKEAIQIVANLDTSYSKGGLRVESVFESKWLRELSGGAAL